MRTSLIIGLLALATTQVSAQYNVTSKPFSLVVISKTNHKLNGTALYACHEGAAIEGLCTGGSPSPSSKQFHFNTSDNSQSESGYLAWTLKGGNFELSEAMELSYSPSSNVAVPLFMPQQYVLMPPFSISFASSN